MLKTTPNLAVRKHARLLECTISLTREIKARLGAVIYPIVIRSCGSFSATPLAKGTCLGYRTATSLWGDSY